MPLNIVIVGAGIAGLVAATSLRQAGHTVLVLEKHGVSNVVGAALNVNLNGNRVLARLGFDLVRARVCRQHRWNILRGDNMRQLSSMPLGNNFAVHRADLNEELVRLATMEPDNDVTGWGPPVEIRIGCGVNSVIEDGMGVVLENGEGVRGDLVVGADGVHSAIKSYVVGQEGGGKANFSGMAAFRFLLETDRVRADEGLASLMESSGDVVNLLADTAETAKERHMIWYTCHGGELLNFVGIHPSTTTTIEDGSEELKAAMAAEFGHFDPKVQRLIELSSHIKRWPLFIHEPLSAWVRGRVVLIGDAAHPMLPFGGQGAAQAMEDGAALGFLLQGLRDPMELDDLLASFQSIRQNRAARVQILSSVRAGLESKVADKMAPYLDETVPQAPASHGERMEHDASYDVYAACEKRMLSIG